jgi:hypothetical protein
MATTGGTLHKSRGEPQTLRPAHSVFNTTTTIQISRQDCWGGRSALVTMTETAAVETAEVVDIENGEEHVKDAEGKHGNQGEEEKERNAKQERKKIDSIIKYRINSTNKNDDYLY